MAGLALLAVVLLVGTYALAAGLVLFIVVLLGQTIIDDGMFRPQTLWLTVGGGIVLVALLRAVVRGIRENPAHSEAVPIARDDAPELWRLVEDLAARMGTTAPTELRLTTEPNASVREWARMAGLRTGHRRVYIGAPLLVALSVDELRAVLCHELGHYVRGHTRLGPITYRGSVTLLAARRQLGRAALINVFATVLAIIPLALLSTYTQLYDRLSMAVRRQQELDADAAAVRVAGREATAQALRTTETIAAAWHDFTSRFLEPASRQGSAPSELFSAFQAMLGDADYRRTLATHQRPAPARRPTIRDSHPHLATRLAAIARQPETNPTDPDVRPALHLLGDPRRLFRRLVRRLSNEDKRSVP